MDHAYFWTGISDFHTRFITVNKDYQKMMEGVVSYGISLLATP